MWATCPAVPCRPRMAVADAVGGNRSMRRALGGDGVGPGVNAPSRASLIQTIPPQAALHQDGRAGRSVCFAATLQCECAAGPTHANPCGANDGQRPHFCPGDQRLRFDCETTLPASVRVTGDDRGLSSARDARSSVRAPVCAVVPACLSADPASERCTALALSFCSVLPATVATRAEVCFVLDAMGHLGAKEKGADHYICGCIALQPLPMVCRGPFAGSATRESAPGHRSSPKSVRSTRWPSADLVEIVRGSRWPQLAFHNASDGKRRTCLRVARQPCARGTVRGQRFRQLVHPPVQQAVRMDLHRTASAQLVGEGECQVCMHAPADQAAWLQFTSRRCNRTTGSRSRPIRSPEDVMRIQCATLRSLGEERATSTGAHAT